MKKIFLLAILGISMNGFSQSDFLKNYKAPDFYYRTFSVGLLGTGAGGEDLTSSFSPAIHTSNFNLDLSYFERSNSAKYQGVFLFDFNNSFRFRKQNAQSNFRYDSRFTSFTVNRIFFNPKWFIGLHDRPDVDYSHERTGSNSTFFAFNLIPTFSVGKGRVEPVRYARNAMDIDFLLSKSGVLKSRLNEDQLTQIANKIAVIQNKRFFDPRRGRIYQLQAMDSIMKEVGVPVERNATYFADLQDAYLYGRVNERLSGLRHEMGIAQGISYFDQQVGGFSIKDDRWFTRVFYNFSYYLPQSYKLQHELQATVVGGLNNDSWGTWLNARYSLGFYPTTRTGMNIGVFVNANYLDGFNTDGFGFFTGLHYDAYYFISPRLRLSAGLMVGAGDGYRSSGMGHINRDFYNVNQGNFQYQYNFGLRYSIF